MNQLQQNILENQKELMNNFTLENPVIQQSTNYSNSNEDDFQFGRIYKLNNKSSDFYFRAFTFSY